MNNDLLKILSKPDNHKTFQLLLIVILLFSLSIRFYWGVQKEGLHMDEILSLTYANHNSKQAKIIEGKAYSGDELRSSIFIDKSNIGDTLADISELYRKNKDTPHTNFYYSFLRLSFLGRNVSDFKTIIQTGIILNCLFFIVEYFFLIKLLLLLFKKNYNVILAAAFCISIAGSSISATLFLRPYQLQTTMLVIFAYVFFNTIEKSKVTRKNLIPLSAATAGALLSGYFSLIFIALAGLFVTFYHGIRKNFKAISYFLFSFFLATILTKLLYLNYWQTLLNGNDRAGEAYLKINLNYLLANFSTNVKIFYDLLTSYALYGLEIWLSIFTLYLFYRFSKKEKIEINKFALVIVAISILFSLSVLWLAPLKVLRYIMPAFPLISLIIPLTLSAIKNRTSRGIVITLFMALYGYNAFNTEKINFAYQNKLKERTFLQEQSYPVYILDHRDWRSLEWSPYANSEQQYLFFSDSNKFNASIESIKLNHLYVILDTLYDKKKFNEVLAHLKQNYAIIKEFSTPKDDLLGFYMLELAKK